MKLVIQIILLFTIITFSASEKKDESATKIFPGSGNLASISSGGFGRPHGSKPFVGGHAGGFGGAPRPSVGGVSGFGHGGRPQKPFGGGVSGGFGHSRPHGSIGGIGHGGVGVGFPGGSHSGVGVGFPGNPHSGVGIGFPGDPHGGGGPSSNCRYWCRNSANQFYCCESDDQAPGPVGEKHGFCPPVRPSCPGTKFGPPKSCSNDYSCPGIEKCCLDKCLGFAVCKAPDTFVGPNEGHHGPGIGGLHGTGIGGGHHGSGIGGLHGAGIGGIVGLHGTGIGGGHHGPGIGGLHGAGIGGGHHGSGIGGLHGAGIGGGHHGPGIGGLHGAGIGGGHHGSGIGGLHGAGIFGELGSAIGGFGHGSGAIIRKKPEA